MRTPLDRKGSGRVGSIVSHREKDRGSKTARASSAAVSPAVVSPESAAYRSRVAARYLRRCGPCVAMVLLAVSAAIAAVEVAGKISPREGAARSR